MKVWIALMGLCAALALGGCATRQPAADEAARRFREPDYEAATLTELSAYLGYLAELPPLQRRDECRWLYDFITEAPGLGAQLHLALALLVTPDCLADQDDLRFALGLLEQAQKRVTRDDLRAFLAYQRLLAQRLLSSRRHEREWNRRLVQLRRRHRHQRQQLQQCRDALDRCQTKLEALKALEKSLNHHGVP